MITILVSRERKQNIAIDKKLLIYLSIAMFCGTLDVGDLMTANKETKWNLKKNYMIKP